MSDPHAEYSRRLNLIAESTAKYRRLDKLLAAAKLIVGVLIVAAAAWLVRYHAPRIALLAVPVLLFIILAVLHERVLQALRRCKRLTAFYERCVARLENRWAGAGATGQRFLDPSHPYARDLDILGPDSLFQLLSIARTGSGEQTLAAWLLRAAPIPEVMARRAAVQELTPNLDFRERVALAGEEVRDGADLDSLTAWAEGAQVLKRKLISLTAVCLALAWLLSLAAWWAWDWSMAALGMSLVNLAVSYRLRGRMNRATAGVEGAARDLALLTLILLEIERENFSSARLVELQAALTSAGTTASRAIAQLGKRVAWLQSHGNWFVKLLDQFIFWTPLCTVLLEAWRSRYGREIRRWIEVIGEIEAANSLAVYAYEHPSDVFPQFVEQGPYFDAEALAHPVLPREKSVSNELKLDRSLQLLVISGPNMAGKSTFIRTVGINAVLAQAGAPVCAHRMSLSSLQIAASICILDSLHGGLSRFYAEISRLKQIDTLSRGPAPVLFLLDELLSGTNSHDRRIGTESFVRSLLSRGAIGLITTHDLALAEIAERVGMHAANVHFEDRFEDGKLIFDYKLMPGVVQTANALELMRSIGLEV